MKKIYLTIVLILTILCGSPQAELIDRVCAFVDNDAITFSEFIKTYNDTKARIPNITKDEVLNTMVNRVLLKRAASAMKIIGTDEDKIITEYIDLKVRSYVIIKEEDIEGFYNRHKKEFAGADIADVRADIEKLLTEEDVNTRLTALLTELRKQAYVKVQAE
ncbi:MAG: SurA N-terminal domain-containing protein [Nitrospirota bacterium]